MDEKIIYFHKFARWRHRYKMFKKADVGHFESDQYRNFSRFLHNNSNIYNSSRFDENHLTSFCIHGQIDKQTTGQSWLHYRHAEVIIVVVVVVVVNNNGNNNKLFDLLSNFCLKLANLAITFFMRFQIFILLFHVQHS